MKLLGLNYQLHQLYSSVLKSVFSKNLQSPQVIISTCHNIYRNLALEDWIYQNVQFTEGQHRPDLLILWRNDPCIVIGRHQNCWVEANIHEALAHKVDIARRRSGGGTVYHDRENLNFTFFTARNHYNRKKNLNLISKMLRDKWKLDVDVTARDDLLLKDQFKVSGTAAKLGGKVAYHHCTLLVNTNLNSVDKFLFGSEHGIISKATASTRSKVANLSDHNPNITCDQLIESATESFLSSFNVQQTQKVYVDPTDEKAFPGIYNLYNELKQWDWIFGHTPKFQVERTFECNLLDVPTRIKICLDVDHGKINGINFLPDGAHPVDAIGELTNLCERFLVIRGVRFWPAEIESLQEQTLNGLTRLGNEMTYNWIDWILDCLYAIASGK